jgi:hypothetical protein
LHFGDRIRSVERVFDGVQLRDAVAAVAAEDRSAWTATARAERLIELREAQERLDAEVLRAVADRDAADAWDLDCLGAVSWLASKTGMVRGAAARLVTTARFVRRHAQTEKALDAGDVTVPHVELLAVAAQRRDALYEEHETVLLDTARTVEVQDFPQVARQWASYADDELAQREAAYAFDRRGFVLSPTIGGGAVSGFFDPEACALIGGTLDDLQPPEGPSDTRTQAQRRADALVLLCERARGGDLPSSRPIGGVETVVSHDVLAGRPLTNLDLLQCEIAGFGPIPRVTAERLVCDCAIARLVINAEGEILDLGRRTRTIPRRLRRAIVLRDQHCQFPGCRAPAAWCDVHHLLSWLLGGETNLENCALLCRRHHVAVHEGGWKLARGPDGRIVLA